MEDPTLSPVFSIFCENSPHFLVVMENNEVLYANAKARGYFKTSKKIRSVILPRRWVSQATQAIIKKIKLPNGQWLMIRWRLLTWLSEASRMLALLIGEEISEIESLRKRAQMLSDIVTKVPGFVFWKDTDLKLIGCNDNFAKQVGLNHPDEIVGLTDHDLPWDAEQTKKFIRDDRDILHTGIPKINIEEKQRQLNGQDIFLLTSKVPLYDQDHISGVLGIYVDITAFKAAERALRAERDKAESANRLKSDFILNMQHDIRTPISGIYGMAELLADSSAPMDIQANLTEMAHAAKELLDYCNDILDFSQIEYGSRPVVQQPFSLRAIIHSVLRMETPAARLKKIRLSIRYGKSTPDIWLGDAYRIKRVLINLISNAIKFTAKGHVKIHVQAEPPVKSQRQRVVQLTVRDSGIGIPADKMDYIYEKFSKLTPSNKGLYKGSGLGLKMVKQFVEEMGGDIAVNSQINQGTTFKVFLPLTLPLSNHILQG